jgi:tyrosine-protein phosphatase YwqE
MTKGFIDIHCHILPGLDEGASTIGESLKMLQIAKNDGVGGIVATPHIVNGTCKKEFGEDEAQRLLIRNPLRIIGF